MLDSGSPIRRRNLRWSLASEVLATYRLDATASRAELTQQLHLSSGTMTDLISRLQAGKLIAEAPVVPSGRGRPTSRLQPHPEGPVVVVAEISASGWRTGFAGIDGTYCPFAASSHQSYAPESVLSEVAGSLELLGSELEGRICATSISVAGTVSGNTVVQSAVLGWDRVEMERLRIGDFPLLVNNDATVAAVAEARRGAARGSRVSTHLMVLSGTGGGTCQDGQPQLGATGAGSEYGHLPIGHRQLLCSCGAVGCWDVELGARALVRDLGLKLTHPASEVSAAKKWLGTQTPDHIATVVASQSAALGRGLGGLVNALDPEVVTLSGLAPTLRRLAPEDFAEAFIGSLMSYRRDTPPQVLDAVLGEDAALLGAVELAMDQVTSPACLSRWTGQAPV